jgi:hypothetical protein
MTLAKQRRGAFSRGLYTYLCSWDFFPQMQNFSVTECHSDANFTPLLTYSSEGGRKILCRHGTFAQDQDSGSLRKVKYKMNVQLTDVACSGSIGGSGNPQGQEPEGQAADHKRPSASASSPQPHSLEG